jgi:hypothetical protein
MTLLIITMLITLDSINLITLLITDLLINDFAYDSK